MQRGHDVGTEAEYRPAHEAEVRPDATDVPRPERVEEGLREAQVRHRPPDPAVLHQPHAVARQAGDDLGPWVEDARVPQVGDEQAATHRGDQIVRG
jgi:hypothetical protein